jgi:pimeloyl-ACP methyl ester carboxylesterase
MGTPRPEGLSSINGLARAYAAFIEKLGLKSVTVIGNSVGGWIAAELALVAPKLLKALVLVDATGIEVTGHPVADPFSIPFEELSRLSYHDPARFRIDPSKFTPQQKAGMAANFAALKLYAGPGGDPTLRGRLSEVKVPTLAVWGESDGVVDAEYGRAYAQAIPDAEFQLLKGSGHLPQIETPELLAETVSAFLNEPSVARVA